MWYKGDRSATPKRATVEPFVLNMDTFSLSLKSFSFTDARLECGESEPYEVYDYELSVCHRSKNADPER